MSLYIDISVNADLIDAIGITRTTSGGTDPDSVNIYRWERCDHSDVQHGEVTHYGEVTHRYGDGALKLVHTVIGEILTLDADSAGL